MSRSNKSWSPSKENLLMQHLAALERSTPSPSPSEDKTKFGSSSSINLDAAFIDLPTEPKRRRIMADDMPSLLGSQENSQVSSRSHSPSLSESLLDDSLMSTPSVSPSGTLKEYFRRKYRKDELWASIETNYKYLMDKGIIEACQQSTESEGEEAKVNSNVSFGEFLQLYQELTDWLKSVQEATQEKSSSSLPLSQKYLKQSYHEEMQQKSSKLTRFNEYAPQLRQRQPALSDEVDIFVTEVNKQWSMVEQYLTPHHQDPETQLRDLEEDLACLRKWLDGIEDHLQAQTSRDWPYEELDGALKEHKVKQKDIESHSRIVSAVLQHCEDLQDDDNVFDQEERRDELEYSAHNLERHWHEIWLQSLEWQCRLEDALTSGKGIFHNSGLYLDPHRFSTLKEYRYTDDEEFDPHDVTSSGDDSFNGLAYRGDFIQSPPKSDSSTSLSPDSDNRSGKDSAVVSEIELKTNSDMSENYQDLSVSTGSDSDREFMRRVKMYRRETRHESRDIGYGSESQSDELEIARYQGITFSGIKSNRTKKNSKSGDFYATVTVDTESSQSAGKTDPESNQSGNQAEQTTTGDESDISLQQVLLQEESEKEDIKYLIDQADILVQKGNSFNAQSKLSPNGLVSSSDSKDESSGADPKSLSSSASSGQAVQMVDKGVGTLSSSGDCDASAEESEDSDEPGEEISMATTDPDTFDSVVGEEYTSDEMRNGSRDYSKLPKLFDTNTLRTRLKGPSRERPWSVIELPKVAEIKQLSASESAIDKLTGTHSDSDLPSKSSWSQNCSPTFQRHRIRRAQCIQRSSSVSTETNNVRSQVGAKRKLNLEPLSLTVNSSQTETGCVSGNTTIVPSVDIYTTDDERTPLPLGNSGLMHTLQSARFKSSGSSFEDSDTQDNAEPDDPNNDASSFSENAWDNYQAPLYPSDSNDRPEKALTWDPMDDMEFDDEFSLPQSTILATLMARRSEEETYPKRQPKLVPSNKGKFDDSDSDIEELHHVLEESRMQLKVADKSLKKKRKDPLGTGLYLNPGKYGELMATIDTNMRCLDSISQHLDVADVTPDDIQTIQDLLYQWEKLQALASERRNQSQELKTMYATYLSIEGMLMDGVLETQRTKFKCLEDLQKTMKDIQDKQKLLQTQQKLIHELRLAVHTFGSQNPSVPVDGFLHKIQDVELKLEKLHYSCVSRVSELDHIQHVWQEYKDTRRDLELLLTQERELLQRIAFSQELEMEGYKAGVESDLKQLVHSLAIYEEKLIQLQRLRAELLEVSDEETQLDLTAGIADIRNQLYVAQKQCQDIMGSEVHKRSGLDKIADEEFVDHMEVEEEITPLNSEVLEKAEVMDQMEHTVKHVEMLPKEPKKKRIPVSKAMPRQQSSSLLDWLKWFPIQAIALAVILGLLYLASPESLNKLLDFSLRFSPELKYVNGPPPV